MKFFPILLLIFFTCNSIFAQCLNYDNLSNIELRVLLAEKEEMKETLERQQNELEKNMKELKEQSSSYKNKKRKYIGLMSTSIVLSSTSMLVGLLKLASAQTDKKVITGLILMASGLIGVTLPSLLFVDLKEKNENNPMKDENDQLQATWKLAEGTLCQIKFQIKIIKLDINKIKLYQNQCRN